MKGPVKAFLVAIAVIVLLQVLAWFLAIAGGYPFGTREYGEIAGVMAGAGLLLAPFAVIGALGRSE